MNSKQSNWEKARLDLRKEYEEPPIILKVDNSIVCTLGNFSASAGKEKSKKTFNVSALTSSLLSGRKILEYIPMLPNDRHKILYIDTEQSDFHCIRIANRIQNLTGMDLDELEEKLIFLTLRKYTVDERLEMVEEAIYANPDVFFVVIDGLRDFVRDINDATSATLVMDKLLKWTYEMNIHIHVVLHLNKSDDNTRGHLGTELSNKSETILKITKDQYEADRSIVSAKTIRDVSFDDFAFFINEHGLPESTDIYSVIERKALGYHDLSEEQHKECLSRVFEENSSMGYKELIDGLKMAYEAVAELKMGVGRVKELKVYLQGKNLIEQKGKTYQLPSRSEV